MKQLPIGIMVISLLVCLLAGSFPKAWAGEPKKIIVDIIEWRIDGNAEIPVKMFNSGQTTTDDLMQILEKLVKEKKAEIISAEQVTATAGQTTRYVNTRDIWYLQQTKDGVWKLQKDGNPEGAIINISPTIQPDGKIFIQLEWKILETPKRMNCQFEDRVQTIGLPVMSSQLTTRSLTLQSGKMAVIGGGTSRRAEKFSGQDERVELKSTILTITATIE